VFPGVAREWLVNGSDDAFFQRFSTLQEAKKTRADGRTETSWLMPPLSRRAFQDTVGGRGGNAPVARLRRRNGSCDD